jgi:hypothetical protein
MIDVPKPGRRLMMGLGRGVQRGSHLSLLLGASLVMQLTEESRTSSFSYVLEGKLSLKKTN